MNILKTLLVLYFAVSIETAGSQLNPKGSKVLCSISSDQKSYDECLTAVHGISSLSENVKVSQRKQKIMTKQLSTLHNLLYTERDLVFEIPEGTHQKCQSSPPFVAHAVAVVILVNNMQQEAVYICDPCYTHAGGENKVRCDHNNGEWDEPTFRCTGTHHKCQSSPPFVEHAVADVMKVNDMQEEALYTCDQGYTYAGGENKVRCDHDKEEWDEPTFRCTECIIDYDTYKGTISKTQGGIECQRWDSQFPHNHPYDEPNFYPEKSITAAENYCRAFDVMYTEPWCYTMDPNLRWDYCGIPNCSRPLENDCGTPSLVTSKNSSATLLYSHTTYSARASYICDTLSDPTHEEYCPVSVCEKFGWSAASMSCGVHDCVSNSSEYIGKRTCTVSGRTCQRWDSQYPNPHSYGEASFPDGSATNAGNFCRDPVGYGTTWCYTIDPIVLMEVCDVPSCVKFQ